MSNNKTVAVLGLGLFGASVARTLEKHDLDVIAMDKKMERVEEVAAHVEHSIQGDFTKIEHLEAADVGEADIAIVASGERLEEAIMCVLNLKKLGVRHVIVKTKNKDYLEVLKKVGADRVVLPEVAMGKRLANEIAQHSVIDTLRIDDRYNLVEIHPLKSWENKTIMALNLRQMYGFNIVAVKKASNHEMSINVEPDYLIHDGDLLFVLVEEQDLERFNDMEDAS
ncbi:TrkA family potassium uptake protein [Erysipelothrix sp. HDW6C]|uniref:potassium channel family protein n=1 Tax=Erysipelothrix sp. HDW6C TaxID=2714930 RepID=UPI00140A5645|nr:TrkA family potassium uptake protein [Erysipelothrix sp. HDW6C]QIK69740.1 TrkA family potassium uptake protein [Erysipelothrix sp. HDW6C]